MASTFHMEYYSLGCEELMAEEISHSASAEEQLSISSLAEAFWVGGLRVKLV